MDDLISDLEAAATHATQFAHPVYINVVEGGVMIKASNGQKRCSRIVSWDEAEVSKTNPFTTAIDHVAGAVQ